MNIKRFGQGNKLLWKDRKRWAGLPLSFTRYFLIEKPDQWVKFFSSVGLLSTVDEELYVFRIFDITVQQTFWNKIFNNNKIHLCRGILLLCIHFLSNNIFFEQFSIEIGNSEFSFSFESNLLLLHNS